MPELKYLYIILTTTHSKMGGLIRAVTHYPYNHVSVALEEKPAVLYSFARHYENAPFYGGFVRESALRYSGRYRGAEALVFAVPIAPERHAALRERLEEMTGQRELYLYNMLSALCAPLHRRVALPEAYTCVEFAVDVLKNSGTSVPIEGTCFYSVEDLARLLDPYRLCQLPVTAYMSSPDWAGDTFSQQTPTWTRVYLTADTWRKLLSRLAHRLLSQTHT